MRAFREITGWSNTSTHQRITMCQSFKTPREFDIRIFEKKHSNISVGDSEYSYWGCMVVFALGERRNWKICVFTKKFLLSFAFKCEKIIGVDLCLILDRTFLITIE